MRREEGQINRRRGEARMSGRGRGDEGKKRTGEEEEEGKRWFHSNR